MLHLWLTVLPVFHGNSQKLLIDKKRIKVLQGHFFARMYDQSCQFSSVSFVWATTPFRFFTERNEQVNKSYVLEHAR